MEGSWGLESGKGEVVTAGVFFINEGISSRARVNQCMGFDHVVVLMEGARNYQV